MVSFNLSAVVAVALFVQAVSAAIGPVADLTISNANVNLDGFPRAATVVNGRVDRTIISANQGDTFQLNVINNLNDPLQYQSTSIHWHGILQKGTAWADGPAFVTQCPISKGHSFLYSFKADVAGTYWYHSHLSVQYCDGARGVLVVYDPNDPHRGLYDVDNDDTVLTLSDWYHALAKVVATGVARPDATLINGLGRSTQNLTAPLSVISVTKGLRYRFRLVNVGCDPNFVFQIDGHNFTIIEVDGVNHQRMVVDSLQIFAGQRYSIVLNATEAVGNYWIRARPNIGADTTFTNGRNSAILRYVGAPTVDPTTSQGTSRLPLIEGNLKPLVANPPPGTSVRGGVDQPFDLTIGLDNGRFTLNGTSFTPPSVPALLQILSGAQDAASLLPAGSYLGLDRGATVELVIRGNAIGAPHPFHLHGHTFHVIRSANSTVDNYIDPPLRDVVSTGINGDQVTIRFRVDNPGPWFLHCHIDWHLEAGLAIVLAEDVPAVAAANVLPANSTFNDLCNIYNSQPPEDL